VANLEQLKFNLLAVIVVMLTVIFLGAAATGLESSVEMLALGGGIALVILAVSVAAWIFQRVHQHEVGHDHSREPETEPIAAHKEDIQHGR
jgi:small neutral amino acid transporter SnatA (MarC family)